MLFSIIIPVYNRSEEMRELLESLTAQSDRGFEVVVVEDGSVNDSRSTVEAFGQELNVSYYSKENGGPALARNYGSDRAAGDFFIYLDSDCIVPAGYVAAVRRNIDAGHIDAFGGPDRAADNFSDMQKAVNYSMTSLFTTGGIRGGGNRKKPDRFYPRSFNMGISRGVYDRTGGFSDMRFGEDIDLSYRIYGAGYRCTLIPDAFVYHKRRTDLSSFFRQVFYSGMARINLSIRYPDSMKPVYALPALFTLGTAGCLLAFLTLRNAWFLVPLLFTALVWFFDSLCLNKSVKVALISIAASFVQLTGYGCGFLYGIWRRLILRRSEADTYRTKFF